MKSIKRILYFYELSFNYHEDFKPHDGDKVAELFTQIMHIVTKRLKNRYQVYGERIVMMQSVSFSRSNKTLHGKLRCIKKDVFPELMNTDTDVAKGIEAKDNEGLVETTHFLIDYSKSKPILCIEHNQFGSKIGDFLLYILTLGRNRKCIETLDSKPIVRDELKEYKNRIAQISQFIVKIHKDNIAVLEKLHGSLFQAMEATVDHFESEYAYLKLKFDYKSDKSQSQIKETVKNLINSLIKKKKDTVHFDTLLVKAQDSNKGYLLETFDLLVDRIKSEVTVEKKEKHRTVVTADIEDKMKSEVIKRFKNYK